jgi:hypothetical protein
MERFPLKAAQKLVGRSILNRCLPPSASPQARSTAGSFSMSALPITTGALSPKTVMSMAPRLPCWQAQPKT